MAYFENFPFREYRFSKNNNEANFIQDITIRTRISPSSIQQGSTTIPYQVRDGETPEQLADRVYDNPQLSWIILLLNNIVNVFEEWPMSSSQLQRFVNNTYSEPSSVHHYEDLNGQTVDSTAAFARPISNFQFEFNRNEEKRNIQLLDATYIQDVINEHNRLVSQ